MSKKVKTSWGNGVECDCNHPNAVKCHGKIVGGCCCLCHKNKRAERLGKKA